MTAAGEKGIPQVVCPGALECLNFNGVDKRQNIYDLYGITVIDDCYNASPESMHAAIDVLVSIAKRKSARATDSSRWMV